MVGWVAAARRRLVDRSGQGQRDHRSREQRHEHAARRHVERQKAALNVLPCARARVLVAAVGAGGVALFPARRGWPRWWTVPHFPQHLSLRSLRGSLRAMPVIGVREHVCVQALLIKSIIEPEPGHGKQETKARAQCSRRTRQHTSLPSPARQIPAEKKKERKKTHAHLVFILASRSRIGRLIREG
jgi:hypothetical protein